MNTTFQPELTMTLVVSAPCPWCVEQQRETVGILNCLPWSTVNDAEPGYNLRKTTRAIIRCPECRATAEIVVTPLFDPTNPTSTTMQLVTQVAALYEVLQQANALVNVLYRAQGPFRKSPPGNPIDPKGDQTVS